MKRIAEWLIIAILLTALVFIGRVKLAAFYSNRGYEFYQKGMYNRAIDSFRISIRLNPSAGTVHYNLAKAYDAAGLQKKATAEYKKAILFDSSFLWPYEALAEKYFRQKRYEEAIAILKTAPSDASDDQSANHLINHVSSEYIAHLLNTAMDTYSSGDRQKAYRLLDKVLKANPNLALTYYVLGYFYYNDNQPDAAKERLYEAVRRDKKFFHAHKLLGDIYFEERDFDEAVAEYGKALVIDGRDVTLLNNLGLALMNLERYKDALNFIEKAVMLSPGDINFRYSLASLYRDMGMLEESAAEYKRIILEQPGYLNVHNELAGVYEQQGRKEEAVKEYKRQIDICSRRLLADPDNPILLNSIARAYNGTGEYDTAKVFINKALSIDPDYQEAYMTLANLENNLCNFDASMKALKEAEALSPQELYFIAEAINNVKSLKFLPTHIVYLQNNRRLEGIMKKETDEAVVLEMDIGSTIGEVTLLRSDIERIVNKYK